MDSQKNMIWQRIEEHVFDDPESSHPFSTRLAKENDWSRAKTARVIYEYRRFLLLAATAGHPVSPSDEVDQAWHLHLLYTRNYWDQMCKTVLEMPLHHEPSRGGAHEQGKFQDWYAKTLSSYQSIFNQLPPADIWPADAGHAHHDFKRIDTHSNWIIPKMKLMQTAVVAILFIAIIAFASGCESVASAAQTPLAQLKVDNPFDYRGSDFLNFYLVILGMAVATAMLFRWQAKNSATSMTSDPNLDPTQIGYLRAKGAGAVRTAITSLVHRGKLKFDTLAKRFEAVAKPDSSDSMLEQSILQYCQTPRRIDQIERASSTNLIDIDRSLVETGLLVPTHHRNLSNIGTLLIVGVLIAGIVKIIVGLQRDRPVGFLVLACFATLVILIVLRALPVFRSRAGDRYFNELKAKNSPNSMPVDRQQTADSGGAMPVYAHDPMPIYLMYALYGNSMLHHDPTTAQLNNVFQSNDASNAVSFGSDTSSSGDSGGSDSGDSGGGDSGGSGCGGCGGGGGD